MSSILFFDEHQAVLAASRVVLPAKVDAVSGCVIQSLRADGKVLICGNGGSAADAQHFAAELVGRFELNRRALPALALTTDTSALTAIANDHGYDAVFERQVQAFAATGDVLIAISTSGNSGSVVRAARAARERGCVVVGMTGEGGGELAALSDHLIAVPSRTVARIQELHELCLHAIAHAVEQALATESSS